MQKFIGAVVAGMVLASVPAGLAGEDEGWTDLFDGKTMTGWRASEHTNSWSVQDGALVCFGPRSHLFYEGVGTFTNFHFKAEVMTTPGSNAGIYFHTRFQETGWPRQGFEAQVNNTHRDRKKTGSLYGIVDVHPAPATDNTWFTQEVIVQGDTITIKVDGKTVVEYVEPPGTEPGKGFTRKLDQGTFALQAHDPKSKVFFRNLRVKRLP